MVPDHRKDAPEIAKFNSNETQNVSDRDDRLIGRGRGEAFQGRALVGVDCGAVRPPQNEKSSLQE
jgi:hypothetical protein